ncbi:MAG: DUF2165 family protein [Devosia sp.]
MLVVRLCKIVFVATAALFFTVVAYGNMTDYDSNWQFVQHVLSMDTIFPGSTLTWRAITDPALQTAAYWGIIGWETLTAVVLWIGVLRLLATVGDSRFLGARTIAVVGLTMAFMLYGIGFVVGGGEWFAMWQSSTWNGESKAFEFIGMFGVILIFLMLPEQRET